MICRMHRLIALLVLFHAFGSLSTAALPDPMIMNDGSRVTSPQQWELRRDEIKQVFQHWLLGVAPPAPGNVSGSVLDRRELPGGKVRFQLVKLSFGPDQKLSFEAAIFLPAGDGPFPIVVHPTFFMTPGSDWLPPTPATFPTTAAATRAAERRAKATAMGDPESALREIYAQALDRGYGVMTFNYQQCGRDDKTYRDSGFFPAYPQHDWRDLAAWAWSMSRCVDYLESQPYADKSKFIALGHSRLGKTALIAGAFDERFALVAPNGSGCAGTGSFRFNGKGRGGKEGLEDLAKNFPQWVSPRLMEFANRVDELPFDQNWMIALCAPRAFIATDALDDPYANGNALKQSWLAAAPVYEFLNAKEKLGIHFRAGGHELAPSDWKAMLDFADQKLRGIKSETRFDEFPPAELLH